MDARTEPVDRLTLLDSKERQIFDLAGEELDEKQIGIRVNLPPHKVNDKILDISRILELRPREDFLEELVQLKRVSAEVKRGGALPPPYCAPPKAPVALSPGPAATPEDPSPSTEPEPIPTKKDRKTPAEKLAVLWQVKRQLLADNRAVYGAALARGAHALCSELTLGSWVMFISSSLEPADKANLLNPEVTQQ